MHLPSFIFCFLPDDKLMPTFLVCSFKNMPVNSKLVHKCACCASKKHVWNSNTGMKGSVFGFGQWYLLFIMVIFWSQDETRKKTSHVKAVHSFIQLMSTLLWCRYCRDSYYQFYNSNPPTNTKDLTAWLYEIHELVNDKLNKLKFPQEFTIPFYMDVEQKYWDVNRVSPQWIITLFSNLYLTALSFPVDFNETEPKHKKHQAAVATLFSIIGDCIPDIDQQFISNFNSALSHISDEWSGYFRKNAEGQQYHFVRRQDLFNFVFRLEQTWGRLKSEQDNYISMFGNSCVDVHNYFEKSYRATEKH